MAGRADVTQHLIGNHQVHVEDDDATCLAYFKRSTGLRRRRGPLFTLGGRYDFRLRRAGTGHTWRIVDLVATAQWATGNQRIMQLAAESRGPAPSPSDFE